MRCLLDTHSLLWSLFRPEKLSVWAKKEIQNRENDIAVSVVSFWEISLKYALGKLELPNTDPEELPGVTDEMGVNIIPLSPNEAASFYNLPRLAHKDPFDRLIIWQAIQQKMTLISKDREFRVYGKYGLKTRW
ncbi:MAG: type II toxin-antitoxin system VapC family toxin [Deltaproteobacteria bacterium]|nr:type II toxin-antitoxin system VapC family toxin [Deltaproteobacteria bacterium]